MYISEIVGVVQAELFGKRLPEAEEVFLVGAY